MAATNPTQTAKIARAKRAFQTLNAQMNGAYLEKTAEIKILQVALIAEEPVVFLGEAGIGKTAISKSFAKALEYDANSLGFYEYLLNRFTTPAELFGTVSLKKLRENDVYAINPAGKMPEANVAFLDEIFKCNSATLNALLTILNEREFDNGEGRVSVPLELCIGASNEMPEEDCGLEPLWDRFVLRYWSDDIAREDSFLSLLTGEGIGKVDEGIVSREDIATLRELRDQVDINSVLPVFLELRTALKEKAIRVSSRRWRKAMRCVKAAAALAGRNRAVPSDCQVLAAVLWDQPDQCGAINALLAKYAPQGDKDAIRNLDAARELNSTVSARSSLPQIGKAKAGLVEILNELNALEDTDTVIECREQVKGWLAGIERTVLAAVRTKRR
jgi:MoxR-like ATPase